jgi:hypothetical protein
MKIISTLRSDNSYSQPLVLKDKPTLLKDRYEEGEEGVPRESLGLLAQRGMDWIVQIEEQRPLPIFSIIVMFVAAAAQAAAGYFLMSVVPNLASSLLSEAWSDLKAGYNAIKDRAFDWLSWGIGKGVSLLMAAAMGGKQAAQAYKLGWKEAQKAVLAEAPGMTVKSLVSRVGRITYSL